MYLARFSDQKLKRAAIPDFAIMASPAPTGITVTVGKKTKRPTDIYAPSLQPQMVVVPVIVEVTP